MSSQDVWKFTPVSYRTSALWGRCPALTPIIQVITPSRASGTADHVLSLDDLFIHLAFLLHSTCLPFAFNLPSFCIQVAFLLPSTCLPFSFNLPSFFLQLTFLFAFNLPFFCLQPAFLFTKMSIRYFVCPSVGQLVTHLFDSPYGARTGLLGLVHSTCLPFAFNSPSFLGSGPEG